jgi:hypothetical protein
MCQHQASKRQPGAIAISDVSQRAILRGKLRGTSVADPLVMTGRSLLVSIIVGVMGISISACSGSVTGTDLSSADGGTNGGGGLLGGGGLGGGGVAKGTNGTNPAPAPSSSSTSPAPTTNAGICGTTDTSGSATCDACLTASCCASYNACGSNTECIAVFQCAKTCNGDDACVTDCLDAHPAGRSDAGEFALCHQSCGACQ